MVENCLSDADEVVVGSSSSQWCGVDVLLDCAEFPWLTKPRGISRIDKTVWYFPDRKTARHFPDRQNRATLPEPTKPCRISRTDKTVRHFPDRRKIKPTCERAQNRSPSWDLQTTPHLLPPLPPPSHLPLPPIPTHTKSSFSDVCVAGRRRWMQSRRRNTNFHQEVYMWDSKRWTRVKWSGSVFGEQLDLSLMVKLHTRWTNFVPSKNFP